MGSWTGPEDSTHHALVFQPGSIIAGKYRVERMLGAGGMGAVYVAINQVLQKRVALKVMSGAAGAGSQSVDRFFREAMSASRVRHPAIVEIYDAGMHEGAPWMAMELLDGESLAERLERGQLLAPGEVLPIMAPVLAGLVAVHAQGIVHRDLKPDNIFLERLPDGGVQPKILDFGIAKTQGGPNKLTATGAVMGTAHYLAPEQARDSSTVDPRTDLYAIGVVLYEALSGRMPHDASTLPELVTKIVSEDPAPLLSLAPHVPPELANVVHWCLARDPAARPQTATALFEQLQRALANVPVIRPTAQSGAAGSSRQRTGTADPAAGSALAGAAGLGWAPTEPPHGSAPPDWNAAGTPNAGVPPTGPGWSAGPGGAPPWGGGAAGSSPGSPPAWGSPVGFGNAPAGFGSAVPKKKNLTPFVVGFIVLSMLGSGCLTAAPLLLGALGVSTSTTGGGGMFGRTWPRWWESWRRPFLIDVNGDGRRDVVGWARQNIDIDMHELLCAYDGRDGSELWCADVGEQDDIGDTETTWIGQHVVYFTAHGHASAFRLRDGERLDWQASVRGKPESVCGLGDDRVAVHTPDGLWSILTVATGRVELAETEPASCRPLPVTSPPLRYPEVTSRTWKPVYPQPRLDTMRVGAAFLAPDEGSTLVIGRVRGEGRQPGAMGLLRDGELVWQQVVPADPLRAQAQPPEAVAINDDLVFASYEMTARGDAPRHLAAFRIADGQRVWDVPLVHAHGQAAWYVIADESTVVLSVNETLYGFDTRTGDRRFQIGEPAQQSR